MRFQPNADQLERRPIRGALPAWLRRACARVGSGMHHNHVHTGFAVHGAQCQHVCKRGCNKQTQRPVMLTGLLFYRIGMRCLVDPTKGLEPLTCCLRNCRHPVRGVPPCSNMLDTSQVSGLVCPWCPPVSRGLATWWLHAWRATRGRSTVETLRCRARYCKHYCTPYIRASHLAILPT